MVGSCEIHSIINRSIGRELHKQILAQCLAGFEVDLVIYSEYSRVEVVNTPGTRRIAGNVPLDKLSARQTRKASEDYPITHRFFILEIDLGLLCRQEVPIDLIAYLERRLHEWGNLQ